MRTTEGRLKVLDFGLAKLRGGSPTESQRGVETLKFGRPAEPDAPMAATLTPEQKALAQTATPDPKIRIGDTAPLGAKPSDIAAALEDSTDEASSQPSGGLTPSTLTLAGQLVGTPAYMAPEQTGGGSGDPQSEVFSLGIVLYELLAGKRPFDRDSITETLDAVREAPLFPPSVMRPERKIPAAVDALVMRALERDRRKRWADMHAFATALRQVRTDLLPPDPRARRRRLLATAAALFALGSAGVAVALVYRSGHGPSITVRSTRHLTFDPGCEEYPSLSPDGRTLVYDGLAGDDYEILALDLTTGKKKQLTHAKGWDYAAALSPDGRTVAYTHTTDAGRELRVIPFEGDESQPPLSLGFSSVIPAWMGPESLVASPNGDVLQRIDLLPSGPRKTQLAALPPGTLVRYVTAFPGGDLVALWQPSRQVLEFVLGELPVGGAPRIIETNVPLDQVGLASAPRADGYYYARHGGAANELLRRPRGGGAPVVVPGGVSASSGFSLSADGKRLAYSTCREINYIARLHTGQPPAEILPRGGWRDHKPQQIDAHRYVYLSDRTGPTQVWLLDTATHETRPITGPDTLMGSVSHDGKLLAYNDRPNGGLYVVPLAGGTPKRITDDPTDSQAQFSFDDKTLVFQRTGEGGSRIFVVPVDGGEVHAITQAGVDAAAVSPTRNQVIYLQPTDGGSLVMQTDLRGGRPELVFKYLPPGDYESPHISPDGKRLMLIRKMVEVFDVPLDERNPTPNVVWRAGTDGIVDVDYARDGDGFIAAIAVWDGDLWLAEGDFR
jgi:Tol biopolymer transport system component